MKGYVDTTAGEIQIGDTLIDPVSGVLCRVESVEPVNAAGVVTLHMRGSVSLGYMGITGKPDRPLRRAPRHAVETVQASGLPVYTAHKAKTDGGGMCESVEIGFRRSPGAINPVGMCACGKRLERECADECVR